MNKVAQAETAARNAELMQVFSDDPMQKTASSGKLKEWFQTYLRNDGVARRMLSPEPISDADITITDDTIDPFVIRTFQPYSAGALGTNFDTGTVQTYMHANKYRIYLQRLWTPVYRIDKIFLASYNGPLVDVFKDLMMMDILHQEDVRFRDLADKRAGVKSAVNSEIGMKQYIELGASITTAQIFEALKGMALSPKGISASKVLIQRAMWFDILGGLKAYEHTNMVVEKTLFGKTEALEENLAGVRWVTALNRELIAYRTMYMFPKEELIGDFLTWGEASIHTEVEQGIILKMNAHETVGMNIPVNYNVFKADFTEGETAESWLAS